MENSNDKIEQIEEQEKETFPVAFSQEYLKENTKIRGWLAFFLIAIILGGIISAVYPLATMDLSEYDGDRLLAFADVIDGFLIFGIAVLTTISFI